MSYSFSTAKIGWKLKKEWHKMSPGSSESLKVENLLEVRSLGELCVRGWAVAFCEEEECALFFDTQELLWNKSEISNTELCKRLCMPV